MTEHVDVVVIGAGAAGLAAAFSAASQGASVLLLERSDGSDSNFAVSGGLIAAADTPAQALKGITDSPQIWARDIAEASRGAVPAEFVDLVTRNAARGLALIEAVAGEPFAVVDGVRFPGHSRARLHSLGARGGHALAALLLARAADHPAIEFVRHCGATRLLHDARGVHGVRVLRDGVESEIHADAVIVATGGFGADADMVRRYMPEMADAFYIGSPTNNGDAFRWAVELGATPILMAGYQGHGHATLDGLGRLGTGVTSVGAFIVDRSGRRFVREDLGPSALAGHVASREGGVGIEIYSDAMHQAFMHFAPYREAVDRGAVRRFDGLSSLCEAFSIDAAVLADTLAQFNAFARGEATDRLGREHFAGEVAAPFWAVGVTAALVHTQGGLRVANDGAVLRDDGTPITGLFAAGGCVLGITGETPAGYLPGHGLGQAFALGYVAGRGAAAAAAGR